MQYKPIDQNKIELMFEPQEDIYQVLLKIAEHSYDTALPRGLGQLRPFQASSREAILEEKIETEQGQPVMLLMDYIHGRDCRTKVYQSQGKWFFDAYAFEQRGVTSEKFLSGERAVYATDFLDEVIELLSGEGE